MNWYPISSLAAAFISLILAVFVFLKGKQRKVNRLFSIILVLTSFWCLSSYFVNISVDANQAFMWTRLLHVPAIVVPGVFLHFVLTLDQSDKKKYLIIIYGTTVFILVLSILPDFILGVYPAKYIGYSYTPGPLYYIFAAFFGLAAIIGYTYFFLIYRKNEGFLKIQIKYFLISMLIAIVATLTFFLSNITSKIAFPPIDNAIAILFVLTFSYALMTHDFIKIKSKISKVVIASSLVLSLALSFSLVLYIYDYLLYLIFGSRFHYLLSIIGGLVFAGYLAVFKMTRTGIIEFANNRIYGKGAHSRVVSDISTALISMLEIRNLISYLTESIAENLNVEQVSIMLRQGDMYKIRASKNINNRFQVVKAQSEFTSWFIKNQRALTVYELNNDSPSNIVIRKNFERLKAEVVVPLIYKEKLLGLLNLYKKTSGKMYSSKDIHTLEAISRSASIALENARLYEEAVTDSLTSLYHHKYFQMRLKEELIQTASYKYPISLIMVDIDHFKEVNDKHGHQIGDQVLQEISIILKENVRFNDIVARYGGEEFAVITTGVQRNKRKKHKYDAIAMAKRLRKLVQERKFSSLQLSLTISLGVAIFNGKGVTPDSEALIKLSDDQLYKAKKTGRNKVCHADFKVSKIAV